MTKYTNSDYLKIVQNGLETGSPPKRVIIVGAGMAGLVAAYELQRAGHDPFILEAQPRVGGRILTLREPFSPGLYGEAGAMRLPRSHDLTMAYIDKFELKTVPFTMGNPNAYVLIAGKKMRIAEFRKDPNVLGFELKESERGKTANQLWDEALEPLTSQLEAEGEAAWDKIIPEYDQYSLEEFLMARGWSEGAMEMFGLFMGYESRMNESFIDIVRPEVGQSFANLVYIEGGMDQFPRAFMPALQNRIRFGAKMTAIDQSPDGVTIHYRTGGGRDKITGEYAIITIPFSVLRHVEVLKPFSSAKQRAIRQIHYDASAKVFLQARRRFWEEDDQIFGGGSVTDLAIRNCYYPDHGRETGRGVMLASYTWAEDAQRWGSLLPEDRVTQAIEDVSQLHPQIDHEFEAGASKMWHDDEFAGGAFALFDPEQFTLLYDAMIAPEGRIHFAGEHASVYHRWIQGAIESGLRAAREVHENRR